MATPEEIQKLIKELDKVYKDLGKTNPFKDFDASKISDASAAIAILNSGLRDAKRELDDIDGDLNEISVAFKKTVDEIKNTNSGLNLVTKTMSGLSDIARKLKSDQAGIYELTGKELESLKKQSLEKREDLKISKDLLTSRISELKELEKKGQLNEKEKKELIQSLAASKAVKSELREQDSLSTLINNKLNQRIKQEERIEKLLGLGGAAVSGTKTALDKLGFGGLANALGLDKVKEKMDEVAKSVEKSKNYTGGFSDKMKVLQSGISEAGTQFKKNLTDPAVVTGFLLNEIVTALQSADKATGELAKSFNISYEDANKVRGELNTIANLSADVNVNTKSLQESMVAVGKQLGSNVMLNQRDLVTFTKLREQAAFTNEELGSMQRLTLATGGTLEDNTGKFLAQAQINSQNKGVVLNTKQLLQETATVSDAIKLTVGGTAEGLGKAAGVAKSLGMNLEQVDKIAGSLLDFESSISSELEAELVTGKNLNLEKARLAALNGDLATVAEEISKQAGSAAEFTKMNRVQQEALAKSVGMNREELAKTLVEREALVGLSGDEAKAGKETFDNLVKQYGVEKAQQMIKEKGFKTLMDQQSIQERFNKGIEKLRDLFIGLTQPILDIVSPLVDLTTTILPLINVLLSPIISAFKFVGESVQFFVSGIKEAFSYLSFIGDIVSPIVEYFQKMVDNSKGLSTVLNVVGGTLKFIVGLLTTAYLIEQGRLLVAKFTNKEKEKGIAFSIRESLLGAKDLLIKIGQAAMTAFRSLASIPVVGPVLGAAAAASAIALGYKFMKGDDVMSEGGYGKRTLLAPEGAIKLNDKDTVIAGTNLNNSEERISPLGAIGKAIGSLLGGGGANIDISPLIQKMDEVNSQLISLNSKSYDVYLDSTKLGTGLAVGTSKVQ